MNHAENRLGTTPRLEHVDSPSAAPIRPVHPIKTPPLPPENQGRGAFTRIDTITPMNYNENIALDLLEEKAEDFTLDLNDIDPDSYWGFLQDAFRDYIDSHNLTLDNTEQENVVIRNAANGAVFQVVGEDGAPADFCFDVPLFEVGSRIVEWVENGAANSHIAYA